MIASIFVPCHKNHCIPIRPCTVFIVFVVFEITCRWRSLNSAKLTWLLLFSAWVFGVGVDGMFCIFIGHADFEDKSRNFDPYLHVFSVWWTFTVLCDRLALKFLSWDFWTPSGLLRSWDRPNMHVRDLRILTSAFWLSNVTNKQMNLGDSVAGSFSSSPKLTF